ncbi:DUF1206 domain-containing protein [Propionibacteriaceae bacterium Y1685]|uniref:DUF1206 domain-containing protein n=1 Tax=Microlunatus sp. Y1700 TaxID=3418487 RepID=UPI003B7D1EE7
MTDTAGQARDKARAVERSRPYGALVAMGLVCFGFVHLLIAGIALRLAWGGGGGEASSQGALQELAQTPLGPPVLAAVVIGMIPLAGWQVLEALWGYGQLDQRRRIRRRLSSAGRAVVYLALAVSTVRILSGAGSSGEQGQETWTGRLMQLPLGQVLVLVVAAVIIAVGVSQIVKGVRQKFLEDLAGGVSVAVRRLGQVGHIVKGLALIIVGGLFAWAAITFDPEKAGGMDAALRTVGSSPFGSILLTVMALGIACFGLYCFAWARNRKRS